MLSELIALQYFLPFLLTGGHFETSYQIHTPVSRDGTVGGISSWLQCSKNTRRKGKGYHQMSRLVVYFCYDHAYFFGGFCLVERKYKKANTRHILTCHRENIEDTGTFSAVRDNFFVVNTRRINIS